MTTPEERAREVIDAKFSESDWIVQSRDELNLTAGHPSLEKWPVPSI